jgi:predicted small lipoprotein YifL
MRFFLALLMAIFLTLNLGACGTKGSLRTPAQMEQEAAKKARKEKAAEEKKKADVEKAAKEEADKENSASATPETK